MEQKTFRCMICGTETKEPGPGWLSFETHVNDAPAWVCSRHAGSWKSLPALKTYNPWGARVLLEMQNEIVMPARPACFCTHVVRQAPGSNHSRYHEDIMLQFGLDYKERFSLSAHYSLPYWLLQPGYIGTIDVVNFRPHRTAGLYSWEMANPCIAKMGPCTDTARNEAAA